MKKFLLSLALLSATLLPGAAQQRSEAEADAIAKAFMQNNGYEKNTNPHNGSLASRFHDSFTHLLR